MRRKRIWLEFSEENVHEVPKQSGIYKLANSNLNTIYFGKSYNLKKNLLDHICTHDIHIKKAKWFQYETREI